MNRALPEGCEESAVFVQPDRAGRDLVHQSNRGLDAFVAELTQQVVRHAGVALHGVTGTAVELVSGVDEDILVVSPPVVEKPAGHQRVAILEIQTVETSREFRGDGPVRYRFPPVGP